MWSQKSEGAHDDDIEQRAFIRKSSTSAENCRDSLESRWAIGAANICKSSIKFNYRFTQSFHRKHRKRIKMHLSDCLTSVSRGTSTPWVLAPTIIYWKEIVRHKKLTSFHIAIIIYWRRNGCELKKRRRNCLPACLHFVKINLRKSFFSLLLFQFKFCLFILFWDI